MSVRLHIDELVLDGVARRDATRVRSALERELARLLADRPVAPRAASSLSIDAGPARVRPEALGAQIARGVHGGLSR